MYIRTIQAAWVAAYSMWLLTALTVIAGTAALAAGKPGMAGVFYAVNTLLVGGSIVLSVRAVAQGATNHVINHFDVVSDAKKPRPVRRIHP